MKIICKTKLEFVGKSVPKNQADVILTFFDSEKMSLKGFYVNKENADRLCLEAIELVERKTYELELSIYQKDVKSVPYINIQDISEA